MSAFITPLPVSLTHRPTSRRPHVSTSRPYHVRMTYAPLLPNPNSPNSDHSPPPNLMQLAQLEVRAGDLAAAVRLLSRHVVEDPTCARSWLQYGKISRRAHGPAHSVTVMRRAVAALPKDPFLWHFLGSCVKLAEGRSKERFVYQEAILHCKSAALYCAWAVLEADCADFQRAEALFTKAASLDIEDSYIYMSWAKMETRRRNYTAAKKVFEEGVKNCPKPNVAILYTAYAQMEANCRNMTRARFLYMRAAESNPKDPLVWQAWACLEEKANNTTRARELFERGVVANPTKTMCWQAWGMLEMRAGQLDAARCLFERGTRADSADSSCWQAWASLEARQRNFVEARRLFAEAAERVGRRRAAVLFLGWARLESDCGDNDAARDLYQKGLERKNERNQDIVRLLTSWGGLEKRESNLSKARQLYTRALSLCTRDHKTLHALSQLEEQDGNYSEARDLLRKGIKVSPNDMMGVRALALLEWKRFADDGGVERARELLSSASRRHRNDASLLRIWADFEREQGDHALSQRLFSLADRNR